MDEMKKLGMEIKRRIIKEKKMEILAYKKAISVLKKNMGDGENLIEKINEMTKRKKDLEIFLSQL